MKNLMSNLVTLLILVFCAQTVWGQAMVEEGKTTIEDAVIAGYGLNDDAEAIKVDEIITSFVTGENPDTEANGEEEDDPADRTEEDDEFELVDKTSEFDSIKVFPNPASNVINVALTDFESYAITVYDMTGKRVMQELVTDTNLFTLDVIDLQEGLYIIQLENDAEIVTQKLKIAR